MPLADQDRARIPMGTTTYIRSILSVWLMGTLAALMSLVAIVSVWAIVSASYVEGWLTYISLIFLVLLSVPCAGLLLRGFSRSLRNRQRAQQLRYAGVSTTGTVTDIWTEEAVSEEASDAYYMAYRFSAPTDNGDLETLQLKQRIKRRTFSQLQPGEVVTVRYEAGHPENATAEAD